MRHDGHRSHQPVPQQAIVRGLKHPRRSNGDPSALHTVTAQLKLTSASLVRLLSVTGARTDFVLASADGETTVRVGLTVSSVPDAELLLGRRNVVLDWSRWTIAYGHNRGSLSRMELRLLAALMDSAPEAATREHLVSRLWEGAHRGSDCERAVAVWVFALRRKFAAIGLPRAIRTVRGTGYRLSI